MLDFILVTPTTGNVTSETCMCEQTLRWARGLSYRWWHCTEDGLGRGRSLAVTKYLKGDLGEAPYLIFVDRDVVFSPRHIQMLLDELQTKDVVAGLYPIGSLCQIAVYNHGNSMKVDKTVQEFQFVSTGFMGITKDILQRLADTMPLLHKNEQNPLYPFFCSRPFTLGNGDEVYLTEDWDFCEKVRDVGGTVWAHTGLQLKHKKSHLVGIGDVFTFEKEEKDGD